MGYLGEGHSKFNTASDLSVDGDANVTGSVDATSYTGDGSSLTGINTDLVGDTTPQLGGDLSTNGNDINFGDSDKAQFGASNDLQIYHDGSNSYIDDSGTGNLKVRGANVNIEKYTGETMAEFIADGETNLRYNHALKFKTTSDGIEALRPASDGIIQSWRRGTTEVAKLTVESTDNVVISAMQGGGAGLMFWGGSGTDPIINPVKEGSSTNGEVRLGRAGNRFLELHLTPEGGSTADLPVRQGLSKSWARINSQFSVFDSYNIHSITDVATGRARYNHNNDMNNANYETQIGCDNNINQIWAACYLAASVTGYTYTGSSYSAQGQSMNTHGDLA